MTPDEFVYYFELDDLEPLHEEGPGLAGVPPRCSLDDMADTCEPMFRVETSEPDSRPPVEERRVSRTPWTAGHSDQSRRSRRGAPTESEDGEGEKIGDPGVLLPTSEPNEADLDRPSSRADEYRHQPSVTVAGRNSYVPRRARNGRVASPSQYAEDRDAPDAEVARSPAWGQRDLISVHALGQFTFCNRAGVYAAEHGEESDPEEFEPRLDFLPNFDLERIEEQLSKMLQALWGLLILTLVFAAAMVGGVAVHSRRVFYPALAGCLVCLVCLPRNVRANWILIRRRSAARRARASEPEPTFQRIEPVNWWSMLKAGFEPVSYRRQMRHPVLPLEGNPWRVLERASLRIPVILSGGRRLGDAKHSIYPKHALRLAAYAVLLEATEHVHVPYGVIFPANSHLGLAVPLEDALRDRVATEVRRARDLLSRSQAGESDPRPPHERQHCTSCPHGVPQPISDSEIVRSRQLGERLLILEDRHDRRFHCPCGDRFGSAPPHVRIIELGLRASVGQCQG